MTRQSKLGATPMALTGTGMDAEGAKDRAYQAAYRSCMRRKGF